MEINKIMKAVHDVAVNHGWWEDKKSFGDVIALCHSELSEAFEEYRNGHKATEVYHKCKYCGYETNSSNLICCANKKMKPEGIPIELADCIIRILDYCGHEGIDIEEAIKIKHEYNKTRSYKHGGKIL